MAVSLQLVSERIEVEDSIDRVNTLFYERGWTDGLPIIPPTEERGSTRVLPLPLAGVIL